MIFLRQRAALPRGQAVKHGAQKGGEGGLAGFVGRFDHVQPWLKAQRAALQLAVRGVDLTKLHVPTPFKNRTPYYIMDVRFCLHLSWKK